MNLLRENLIFVFFGACFAVCAVLWLQLSRIPEFSGFTQPAITANPNDASRVENVLALADRMITTITVNQEVSGASRVDDSSRTPFQLPEPERSVVVQTKQERPELPPVILSSISWNDQLPLTVINGDILTEGEPIPNSEIRVRRIYPESVLVVYKGYQYRIQPRRSGEGG